LNGTLGEQNNYYVGLSMYHLNRPRQSFLGANYTVNPRFTVHGGGYFYVGTSAILHVSAIHQTQGGAQETMFGGALQISTDPENDRAASIYIGSWMRLKDAIIPYLGLEFNDFRNSKDSDRTLSYISDMETENPKSEYNKQRRRDIKELAK
jgi:hypothetical protein